MIRAQPMDAVVVVGGCDKTLAGADHGRDQRRPADGRGSGRADGRRPSQGRDARRLHRLPPALVGRTAPARSTLPRSNWSTAGWRRRSAPAWSWAPPAPWPSSPRRWASPCPSAPRFRRRMPSASARPRRRAGSPPRWPSAAAPLPSELVTPAALRNAMVVLQAIGGSTNGVIHLAAIAGRAGHRDRSRRVRPDRPRGAGAGRPEAVGRALYGAFPRGRRRAAAARRAHRLPRPVGARSIGGGTLPTA